MDKISSTRSATLLSPAITDDFDSETMQGALQSVSKAPRVLSCLRLRGEKEKRVLPAVQLTFVTCPATGSC